MPRIRRIVQSDEEDEEDEDSPEKTIVTKDSVDIASDEEEWNGETEPLSKSKLATPVIRAYDTNGRPKRAAAVSANKYIKAMVEEYTASSSHSKNASPRSTLKNTSTPSKMRILDSDTDEGSKSSSSVEEVVSPQLPSRSSGRSGTLSARKAANRENTILEYEKLSKGGLSAVLVDDSDEEYDRNTSKYNKTNDSKNDDDYDYADDDEENDEDRYGVMKPLASSFFDKRKKKPTTITNATSTITKTARPSSYEAKEEYYDYVDSDMDDFIVDDEEQENQFIVDEDDDDHTYKKKKRKDKEKSHTKNRTSTPSSSTKMMSNVDTTMTPIAKSSSSSSSSVQKEVTVSKARRSPRIIDDDDDDDEDDNNEKKNLHKQSINCILLNSSSSSSTRLLAQDNLIKSTPKKSIVKSDYSEEKSDESNAQEENEDDDESEEENEDNESDSDSDSPLAHWQVNAMLDQQREMSSMNNNAMRKNFSKEEAMQLYIRVYAKTHFRFKFPVSRLSFHGKRKYHFRLKRDFRLKQEIQKQVSRLPQSLL